MLFGTVLGLDDASLILVTSTSSIALIVLAIIYRPLVLECLDPIFLRSEGRVGPWVHMVFLILLVMTLVAGFQVLGTLMVVGIMMLPATAARFWVHSASSQMTLAAVIGMSTSYAGLFGVLSLQRACFTRHYLGCRSGLLLFDLCGPLRRVSAYRMESTNPSSTYLN